MRMTVVVAVIIFASLAPAVAQEFTAAQREACKADYEQFCNSTMPGGGRVLACLSKQDAKLSAACKKIVDAQKK